MNRLLVALVALLAGCSQGVMPEGFRYGEIGTRQEDFLSGLLKDDRLKGKKITAELNSGGEAIELDRDPAAALLQMERLLKSAPPGQAFLRVGTSGVASFEAIQFEVSDGAVASGTFQVEHPTSELFDKLVAQATKRTGITPKKESSRANGRRDKASFVNCESLIFYGITYSASQSPWNASITDRSLELAIFRMGKDGGIWRDYCATGPKL